MPYKDPEKQREAVRILMRKSRAKARWKETVKKLKPYFDKVGLCYVIPMRDIKEGKVLVKV